MARIPLPMDCNKCGSCCSHGGTCYLRGWEYWAFPLEFEGRCDFLVDAPDGTKHCLILSTLPKKVLRMIGVAGECNFPEDRTVVP